MKKKYMIELPRTLCIVNDKKKLDNLFTHSCCYTVTVRREISYVEVRLSMLVENETIR